MTRKEMRLQQKKSRREMQMLRIKLAAALLAVVRELIVFARELNK